MQRTLALLLAAALLAVPAASAKTVSVEVPWEKARTIIAEGDFRPKIWVELQSSERLKGKLSRGDRHGPATGAPAIRNKDCQEREWSSAIRSSVRTSGDRNTDCAGRDSHDPAQTPQDDPLPRTG